MNKSHKNTRSDPSEVKETPVEPSISVWKELPGTAESKAKGLGGSKMGVAGAARAPSAGSQGEGLEISQPGAGAGKTYRFLWMP